jgi:hypothetical protein
MKLGYRISLFAMLALAVFACTWRLNAQRPRNRAKVHSMQATSDTSGAHPDKFDADGAVSITCLAAFSETPNARPEPSCRISAPGFNGILKKGRNCQNDRSRRYNSHLQWARQPALQRSSRYTRSQLVFAHESTESKITAIIQLRSYSLLSSLASRASRSFKALLSCSR